MNVVAGARQLDALTAELMRQWQRTRETWSDEQARLFEEHVLASLVTAVRACSRASDPLQRTLQQIRRDCE